MRTAGQARTGTVAALLLPVLAACSAPAGVSGPQDAVPSRIVSMNPCIDAVLREVAEPRQIAGISHYSHDPRATSVPLDWARRFPAVGDGAEDVVAARPDLVLAGPHVASQTVAALDRLGVRLVRLGVPSTVGESQAQVVEIGRITGHEERARTLNARIGAAVAAAITAKEASAKAPRALIWQDGGLVPGRGTLADELLVRTGFHSVSRDFQLAQWDIVSLERLLSIAPDIVMTGAGGMGTAGDSVDARHPALRRATARILFSELPSRMLHCGGPVIIDAATRLSRIRRDWEQRRGG